MGAKMIIFTHELKIGNTAVAFTHLLYTGFPADLWGALH